LLFGQFPPPRKTALCLSGAEPLKPFEHTFMCVQRVSPKRLGAWPLLAIMLLLLFLAALILAQHPVHVLLVEQQLAHLIARTPVFGMFTYISVEEFADAVVKNNKDANRRELIASLREALAAKRNGARCMICGAPIWAAGSAVTGTNMCFTCTTGEADDSEDYEIE